ncbi:heme exporter protein CcmD [Rhizobium alvei]|uniref:Heme exporter protein D n=1 Tax=Rhizobium alvei TaxID=1132659 RepID=A0ABT8YMN5_9HYPH|nr:heme exporter protein CcmD [Rhizobium alvei]MDO6964938.1 heme exporter protein CcmD [Rhizobium alvei]
MNHAFYIYASWGVTVVALTIVTGYYFIESRRLQRELKRLETMGIRRRSERAAQGETA